MKSWLGLILCGALAFTGCGDSSSDSGGSGGTAGSGGAAGAGGEAGTGGAAGEAGMGGEGGSGAVAGMGGEGGTGGMSAAKAFCDQYATTCGFDSGGFSGQNDCETSYEGFSAMRQECVTTHLGFAGGGDTATHCPHATGAAPCN
jgi:hypothetical protein